MRRLAQALVTTASSLTLKLPPIRGLGLVLEYGSRLFSGIDAEIPTQFEGVKVLGNPSQPEGRRLLFTSRYHDNVERTFVRSVLRPGDYAVDVGANIGLYSLLFARLVGPSGKVTSVEAEPGMAARFRRNIALNGFGNIAVVNKGASDKHETLPLNLNASNIGMHSFAVDFRAGSVEVECLPLSEMVDKVRRPRFLKIDVEGFEHRVLRRYFSDTPPAMLPEHLMFEDWPQFNQDTRALCLSHGYATVGEAGPNVMMTLA